MTINTTGDGNYAINGTISTGTSGSANGAADGTVVITGGNYSGNNAFEQLIAGATTDGIVTINGGSNVTVDAAINNNFPLLDDMQMPTGTYGYTYQNVVAGRDAGSSGIINIEGTGTTLDVAGASGGVRIARDGTGVLNVTNGAEVNTFFLDIGRGNGSSGTVNIDGVGASINLNGSTGSYFPFYNGAAAFGRVGRDAGSQGFLNITDGGSLSLSSDQGVNDAPGFQIARDDGSYGRVIVDGLGSNFTITRESPNFDNFGYNTALTVGRGGQGVLEVNNNANVNITGGNTGLTVGSGGVDGNQDLQSRLEISSGSSVNLTSIGNDEGIFINVGTGTEGNGLILVDGSGSQLNVTTDNTDVNAEAANQAAFINIGRSGTGVVSVINGGEINISGGTNDAFPGINIGRDEGAAGTVVVDGIGSSFNITGSNDDIGGGSGFVTVGRAGSGELFVSNSGQFNNNSTDSAMFIGRETTAEGLVEVTGLGSLVDGGELVIVGADFDFSANDDSAIDFVNGGQGRITVVDRGIFRGDEIYLGNGGVITGDSTIDGNVTLNGDDSGMNTAELRPGTGAIPGATLNITGDLVMTYGSLNLELFGTTPVNNDLISVGGIANLDGGSIDISFRNGFTASTGDSFTLVSADDLTFDAANVGAGVFDGAAGQVLLLADAGNELVLTALNNNGTEDAILNFSAGAANGVDLSINDDLDDGSYGYGAGTGGNFDSFAFNNVSEILGTNQNDTLDASGTVNGVTLTGRSGNDIITGGGGLDTLDGNLGNDLLIGGGRADVLNGGGGDDILRGGSGVDVINGGTGNDTNDFSDINAAVIASLVTNTAEYGPVFETFTSIENFIGGNGSDTLTGDGGVNSIAGGTGDDTINGGNGSDILSGDAGIDTINGGNQGDTIDGGGW